MTKTTNHRSSRGNEALTSPSDVGTAASVGVAPIRHPQSEMENCTFSAPNCTFLRRFFWSTLVYQPLARKTAPSQQFDSSVIATWQTPPPTPALWVPGSMKRIAIASNRRNRNRKQARTLILKTEYQ